MAIRAVISVQRLTAEVSISDAEVKHAFSVHYAHPDADIHYQLAEATNIYVDPDSKNRWFYEELPIADVYINVFSTSKSEAISVAETIDVSAGLNKSENLTNSDTFSRQVEFVRPFTEPKTAIDSYQSLLTKPRADTFAVGDVSSPTAHKGILEILYGQQEGPNFISDYVDASYFASDYVGRGLPKIDSNKLAEDTASSSEVLTYSMDYNRTYTDTVAVTDDFDGAASTEDDQTMLFTKERTELVSNTDDLAIGFSTSQQDSAITADVTAVSAGKGLTDSAATADALNSEVSKLLNDTAISGDTFSYTADYLRELSDSATATDDFLGTANADDDQTMALFTNRTETVSANDIYSQLAEKGLSDSVNLGDSGSLRMTDYCDVNYFADSYIGTSATF